MSQPDERGQGGETRDVAQAPRWTREAIEHEQENRRRNVEAEHPGKRRSLSDE